MPSPPNKNPYKPPIKTFQDPSAGEKPPDRSLPPIPPESYLSNKKKFPRNAQQRRRLKQPPGQLKDPPSLRIPPIPIPSLLEGNASDDSSPSSSSNQSAPQTQPRSVLPSSQNASTAFPPKQLTVGKRMGEPTRSSPRLEKNIKRERERAALLLADNEKKKCRRVERTLSDDENDDDDVPEHSPSPVPSEPADDKETVTEDDYECPQHDLMHRKTIAQIQFYQNSLKQIKEIKKLGLQKGQSSRRHTSNPNPKKRKVSTEEKERKNRSRSKQQEILREQKKALEEATIDLVTRFS